MDPWHLACIAFQRDSTIIFFGPTAWCAQLYGSLRDFTWYVYDTVSEKGPHELISNYPSLTVKCAILLFGGYQDVSAMIESVSKVTSISTIGSGEFVYGDPRGKPPAYSTRKK